MNANDLAELVKQKIENLRPKLLDLSRRNPLIATKLGPRSNSHIRLVDELPDILFYKLNNGQELPLVPLPAIDDDPRDERTSAFRDAPINARLTDEQYLAEMESVERDADDYIDRTRYVDAVGYQHDARVGNRTLKAECASKLKIPIEQRKASIESRQGCCSAQLTLYGLAARIRGLVSF